MPSVGWWGGGYGYFLELHIEKKFVQMHRIETCPVEQLGPGCQRKYSQGLQTQKDSQRTQHTSLKRCSGAALAPHFFRYLSQ